MTDKRHEDGVQQQPRRELRLLRVAAGLTQAQLAAEAGVNRDTIVRVEAGHGRPHRATAQALARVLDLPAERLFPDLFTVVTEREASPLRRTGVADGAVTATGPAPGMGAPGRNRGRT